MKLLLADDHGLFRDSMAVWLKQLDSEIVIHFASTFDEVKQKIIEMGDYDLLMLDLGMPGMQGAYSVRVLNTLVADTPLMIVSADENPLVIHSCIAAGAAGYVTKSSQGDTILQAVQQVLSGAEYIPLCARLHDGDPQPEFSEKQMQLLALLAEGHSNKDISEKMHLSLGTVKQYVTKTLRILNVDNRMQAGLKARELLGIGNS